MDKTTDYCIKVVAVAADTALACCHSRSSRAQSSASCPCRLIWRFWPLLSWGLWELPMVWASGSLLLNHFGRGGGPDWVHLHICGWTNRLLISNRCYGLSAYFAVGFGCGFKPSKRIIIDMNLSNSLLGQGVTFCLAPHRHCFNTLTLPVKWGMSFFGVSLKWWVSPLEPSNGWTSISLVKRQSSLSFGSSHLTLGAFFPDTLQSAGWLDSSQNGTWSK